MSTLEVGTIAPISGSNDVTLGGSSKNIKFASGTTVDFSTNTPTVSGLPNNTPAWKAGLENSLNLSSATNTIIPFDSEFFDTDNAYDTSNGRFTVPSGKAGKYFIYLFFRFQTTDTNFDTNAQIFKNGSRIAQTGGRVSVYPSLIVNCTADLAVGDYIQGSAYQSSGNTVGLTSSNTYTMIGGFKLT